MCSSFLFVFVLGLVTSIAGKLKVHYLQNLCKKTLFPWQPGEYLDLENVYVPFNIDIMKPGVAAPIKQRLRSYEEIFSHEEKSKRFLLTGNPGQGKSTFCAKLAYDWCSDAEYSPVKGIELLFILPLQSVDHTTDLDDAISSLLLSSATDSLKLSKVLSKYSSSITLVLDGLDQTPSDFLFHETSGNLVQAIKCSFMTECRIILTTRPQRAKDIVQLPEYKHLELQSLQKSDVEALVLKFFSHNKDSGKDLLKYLDEGKLSLDTSNPLLILLLCWYWSKTDGSRFPTRISKFYQEVVSMIYQIHLKEKV